MSGVLRSAFLRASRPIKNARRAYGGGDGHLLMEQTGRPPKMYVGVEKAPRIPIWEKCVAFTIMMTGSLGYPCWVLYHIPDYKAKGANKE